MNVRIQFITNIIRNAIQTAANYIYIPIITALSLVSVLLSIRSSTKQKQADAISEINQTLVNVNDTKNILIKLDAVTECFAARNINSSSFASNPFNLSTKAINELVKWRRTLPADRDVNNDSLLEAFYSLPEEIRHASSLKM